MGRSRTVGVGSAVLASAAVIALTCAATAPAGKVAAQVRVTTTCAQRLVYAGFANGAVRQVRHHDPGATVRTFTDRAPGLFVVLRIGQPWPKVRTARGTHFQLVASGPRGEKWRWVYVARSSDPEQDSSDYVACLRPNLKGGRSFLARARQNPGSWRFTVTVLDGPLKGATSGGSVQVRAVRR